jgi:alpha-glucosidase
LQLENETLGNNPRITKSAIKEVNETTQAVIPYKFKNVVDHCNELLLKFKGDYAVRFRAYNNGVAYRIEVDKNGEIIVNNEVCEFNFAGGCSVLFPEEKGFQSGYERLYTDTLLAAIGEKQFCSLPALVSSHDGIKTGITETGQSDYPAMFLKKTNRNALEAIFPPFPLEIENLTYKSERIIKTAPYIAKISGSRALPWRCLMFAREDKQLIENNLPYILAEKNILEDVSWIKPGKVAWEWWSASNVFKVNFKSGINTETYKYYIDFASEYGLEYIIMDGGWSDRVQLDIPGEGIDIKEIIRYGKEKGVGVIVWMTGMSLDNDRERFLDVYAKWGVAGIKVDYLNRADQLMVRYYEEIASAAAKRKMLVDFHGAFKPNGLQRKYPNIVNFEGVYGGEMNKVSNKVDPIHNVTIPFTRMLAGPMDYTPGAMRNETAKGFGVNWDAPVSQGTRCHQAAMFVVYESPLQMLCDNASLYRQEPEYTHFITQIPVTWDETVALAGKVKEYIVVARRNGDNWYIGGMTNWTAREIEVDLNFIGEGNWDILYVTDGINADRYPSDYVLNKEKLKNKKLKISMAPGGGIAAILKKKVKTVLILGNSIVRHTPKPDIGWYGNWGMAASAEDSDFVHLLIRDVHRIDPSVKFKYKNIADFERNFDTYSLSALDSLRYPDMLILKISENVDDKKATEGNFIIYYDKLVKYIAPNHQSVKIIADGFWAKENVNRLIEEYALKKKYPFVTLTSLSKDSTNMAIGKFEHKGVAAHPSDKGMRLIEQHIWEKIKSHFGE